MQRFIAVGGLFGALLWLSAGCSSNPGGCQEESDCGPGEYCALGICKHPIGTTGADDGGAGSTSGTTGGGTTGTATGFAATGTASGSSTGLGTSTGSSTGGSSGTTGGTSSGAGTTGTSSGGSSVYCKPCTEQSDCGDAGNLCYQLEDGNNYCLTDCSATMPCSDSSAFCIPTSASDGGPLYCYPETGLCPVPDAGSPDMDAGPDPYCQPCTQPSDGGAAVCPGTAICVSFEYQYTSFCAPDCTATQMCSETTASCDPLNNGNGTSVCAPTDFLCPGADPYCLVCNPDNGNTDCGGNGVVCTTLDDIDYFCAPDCTKTQMCSEPTATCEDGITDANGNSADGCIPAAGECFNAPD